MPIEPPFIRPKEINVVEPVTPAYERVKQMLFKPFDLGKWFAIGFCAWLAELGESGGGGGFNGFNHGNNFNNGGAPAEHFRHFYHQARDYVADNFYWIIPVAAILVLLSLAVWVLVLWLSSRGKFMFLHCVALDRAEVSEPWQKYAGVANSLFRFRLVLSLAGMVLALPLFVMIAVTILKMVLRGEANFGGVMTASVLGLGFIFVALLFALIHKFMVDFVVPIMYLHGAKCLAAWNEFWNLLSQNAGKFTLYILFQIVLSMALGMLVFLTIILTCCIAGCLLLLPIIGTVTLLPVLVFKRAYALYYLAQYGPQYDVFSTPLAPPIVFAPSPPSI